MAMTARAMRALIIGWIESNSIGHAVAISFDYALAGFAQDEGHLRRYS
jgi:hypothetical protein